ncbi:MAG TPA: hypothetical protein VGY48_19075, partial [Vicinamibacterales bacterium]|nr:hypothetical protein [Vicinamibacterales bacterium]
MSLKMNGFWSGCWFKVRANARARSTRTVQASVALAVILAAGPSAQTPQPPPKPAPAPQDKATFKLQVDLVTNDIVVRDEKGNFVS